MTKDPFEFIGAPQGPDSESAAEQSAQVQQDGQAQPDAGEGECTSTQQKPGFESIGPTASTQGPSHHQRFPKIAAIAFEHPADRAALNALKKVPGLGLLLRKFIGFVGERGLRYLYLASAVRVNESQFSEVYRAYLEVCHTLDVSPPPELFVAQTPLVNAGAVGVDNPFIVLNSGTVALLSIEELKVVLGHELGHVLADHVLYKTMLGLLINTSVSAFGIPFGELALLGVIAALREWDRKSELSCDRAGLLAVQDPRLVYTVHMKLAGGSAIDQMRVDEFVKQAQEYHRAGSAIDGIFKLLNVLRRSHPLHVTRLAELKKWAEEGEYRQILKGEYPRRDGQEQPLYESLKDGAKSYQDAYESSEEPLMKFFSDLGETVSEHASTVASKAKDLLGFWNKQGK